MSILATIREYMIGRIGSYLYKQTVLPPFIYFLLFTYVHAQRQQFNQFNAYLQLFVIIMLATLKNFNCAYAIAPFLYMENSLVAVLSFVFACITCTRKWQTYLLFLAIGDSLVWPQITNALFLVLTCSFICFQTYKCFIFDTIGDNILYFSGFVSLALYFTIRSFILLTGDQISNWIALPSIGIVFFFGKIVMKSKVYSISTSKFEDIRSDRFMVFYLQMAQQECKNEQHRNWKIEEHQQACNNSDCFCKKHLDNFSYQLWLRQLYLEASKIFKTSPDPFFMQNYIRFLIKQELIVHGLYYLTNWQEKGFFQHAAKLRCRNAIKKILNNQDSSSPYNKEYEYALNYDSLLLNLAIRIHEILREKVIFWSQASRTNPLLQKLQRKGEEIIAKMYDLNYFYCTTILSYEKQLFSSDATVLYAMYLLSTTNFQQYAECLIKNTSKLLEQVYVAENRMAETFAIRAKIEHPSKNHSKDESTRFGYSQIDAEEQSSQSWKLIIDGISKGLCKMIKIDKKELLGEQLNCVIPSGYKEVHRIRLQSLMNFESAAVRDTEETKVMHRQLTLPIKGGQNNLYMGEVTIKYHIDANSGLSFLSIIKRAASNRFCTALLDFSGKVTELEQGFFTQILYHSEFTKYLKIVQSSWLKNREIREQKFNIMVNTANYSVTISSPLLSMFLEKDQLHEKNPPIHVQIYNEQRQKNRTSDRDATVNMAVDLKEMQKALLNGDNETTNSSRGSSFAVKVLSSFSENSSVSVYSKLFTGFTIILISCFGCNFINFYFTNLPWNSAVADLNPLNDTINFLKMSMLSSKMVSNLWDIEAYLASKDRLNSSEINSFFGENYEDATYDLFEQIEYEFRQHFLLALNNNSDLLQNKIYEKWNTLVKVTDYYMVPDAISLRSQNITFVSLMMNYAIDLSLLCSRKISHELMVETTYSNEVIAAQNSTSFLTVIDKAIEDTSNINMGLSIGMGVGIILILLPIYFLLRQRLPLHQKIFDLIVSIEPSMINEQIKSLHYISNILKDYQENSQILKNNAMEYQENIIYPKRNETRKGSVKNQMTIGLEKYDEFTEIIVSERDVLSMKDTMINKVSLSTIRGFAALKQKEQQKHLRDQRRRDGQLDFKGSDSDPTKLLLLRHAGIYIVIILFIAFLALNATTNLSFFSSIKEKKDTMISHLNQHVLTSLYFMLSKIYLRSGEAGLLASGLQGGVKFMIPFVQMQPKYNYTSSNNYQQIFENCSVSYVEAIQSPSLRAKYCQHNYSYLILLGQYGSLYKQLVQTRYKADLNQAAYISNNQTTIYQQIINNISQKVFYMQSLVNRMEETILTLVDLQFEDILQLSREQATFKQFILIMAAIWSALGLIIGGILIFSMRRQYLKEIYMITLLNSNMILKNKRVQSFLDSLSKSTYN